MRDRITRRDFLDGMALAIVAGLAPRDLLASAPSAYPPSLTGLRGQTERAFGPMHRMVFDGESHRLKGLKIEERYDAIVVGAGISGLAAAHFYRRRHGADSRILILDSLDDFGGHARRNEFEVDGRTLVGYGGSESIQSPQAMYSEVAKALLHELGVEVERFERYFQGGLYPGLGLSRAHFFDRDRFGEDRLVTGDPTDWVDDDLARERRNARTLEAFIGDFPLPEAARARLLEVWGSRRVTLEAKGGIEARRAYLARTPYATFLREDWGLDPLSIACLEQRTLDFFAAPISRIAALDVAYYGYPGFQGIGLGIDLSQVPEMADRYIHHFPDGNASLARLLVRALVPDAIPGSTMEDIVTARADYARLDRPGQPVRLRLDASAVRVVNTWPGVAVGYVGHADGKLRRVQAKHVVLACFNAAVPRILAGLSPSQSAALSACVRLPLVYTNVAVRNWHPWVKLGVHEIFGVSSFHSRVKLDYPVSMGDYECPTAPDQPMVIHMVHVPMADGVPGDGRADSRAARARMLAMRFEDYEAAARRDLARMLGPGGFDADRDIAAITVNRWSHGYAYGGGSLYESPEAAERLQAQARKPLGAVSIANSDAGWSAYAHSAIDQAHRSVADLA